MGNKNNKPHSSNQCLHPRLGNVSRIQEEGKEAYLIYDLVLESQKLYETWLQQLKTVQKIEQDILFLPLEHKYQQTNFCGTGGFAVLKYEDYLYSLEPEIANRKDIKRPFNQQQLLYIFYSLVKVQALFEAHGITIGDIKPQNILVNEDGYARILSKYSYPQEPNRIVGWSKDKERSFLAPQQIDDRPRRVGGAIVQPVHTNQNEVFSIGLTILQAGSLRDCSQIYGYTAQSRYSQNKIDHFLDIFQNRYSQQFTYLLRQMLQVNPNKRIKAQTVYQRLQPYEYFILNLEQIDLRIQNQGLIPSVQRSQKISIRKLGESQRENSRVGYDNNAFKSSIPLSNNGKSAHYAKISLGSSASNQPYVSHIPNEEPNPFSKSLQSGQYYPGRITSPYPSNQPHQPHPIFDLVNQNSQFPRQVSQKESFPVEEKPSVAHSLPLSGAQFQTRNSEQPQYITQNSMVENMSRSSQPLFNL